RAWAGVSSPASRWARWWNCTRTTAMRSWSGRWSRRRNSTAAATSCCCARRRHEPHPPSLAAAGQPGRGAAARPAAAAGVAAALPAELAGAGAGLLADRIAGACRPRRRLRDRAHRRPGLRQPARRTGVAADDHGLHRPALPRATALLPDLAAGPGARRPAAQRPRGRRRGAPGPGRTVVALVVLVGAADRDGPVAADVRAAGPHAHRRAGLNRWVRGAAS